ncbi:MAG: hypothetical protein WAM73_04535 [Desulfobacterales bacterium]
MANYKPFEVSRYSLTAEYLSNLNCQWGQNGITKYYLYHLLYPFSWKTFQTPEMITLLDPLRADDRHCQALAPTILFAVSPGRRAKAVSVTVSEPVPEKPPRSGPAARSARGSVVPRKRGINNEAPAFGIEKFFWTVSTSKRISYRHPLQE